MVGCRSALGSAALLIFVFACGASAQSLAVGDPLEDYLRLLQILGEADPGSFTVRPLPVRDVRSLISADAHPWRQRLPSVEQDDGEPGIFAKDLELRAFVNSRFPTGQNDGVVWQGRGVTAALDAGGTASWRGLSVTVQPTLLFTQNSSFELAPVTVAGMPEYAYPWRRIDLPQRFGPDGFWTLDPGQSEMRIDAHGASLGFGTSNLWWGPSIQNAIVMSDNAPGFPHAFLGTHGPVSIGVGELEAHWIWGRLQQSDWFDPAVTETSRFITGIVTTYSPSFLEGLSVGLTRVFYAWVLDGGVPLRDYLAVFQGLRKKTLATPDNPTGDDEHDQILSLFGRWVLPESGFEVYWEWARNDHSWELRDFLLEPEHSQAYTLGLRKAITLRGDRLLALTGELTHLERAPTFQVRASPTYYAHSIVSQGYTQKGQIIGAGIGPGGDAQHLGIDLVAPWGRAGAYLQRDVHDNDAYYAWAQDNGAEFCCHDVSFHLGADALVFVHDLDLGAGMVITREFNRYFFGLDLWNLSLSISARWRPR